MRAKRRTLLLLDDDTVFRRSWKRVLRDHFDVDDVATIEEAKDSVLAEQPDLAVIDLFASDRVATGLELLPWLAAHSPRTAPVIVSGAANVAYAARAIQRGAVAFLEKPFEPSVLLSTLEGWQDELPSLDVLEWVYVHRMLGAHRGNLSATARRVGRSRQGLSKLMSRTPPRH